MIYLFKSKDFIYFVVLPAGVYRGYTADGHNNIYKKNTYKQY